MMTFDDWWEKYKPVLNHLDKHAGGPYIAEDGEPAHFSFAVVGDEFEYIRSIYEKEPGRVWTLLEEDGVTTISSGLRRVNREGYYITEVPFEGEHLDVLVYREEYRYIVEINDEPHGGFEFETEEQAGAYLLNLAMDDNDIADDEGMGVVRRLYDDGEYIPEADEEVCHAEKSEAIEELAANFELSVSDYEDALESEDTDIDNYEDWLRAKNREILSAVVGVDTRVKGPSM